MNTDFGAIKRMSIPGMEKKIDVFKFKTPFGIFYDNIPIKWVDYSPKEIGIDVDSKG
jgi:hypothetical protein